MPRSASSSKSISTHRSWEGSSTAFSMCLLISQRRSVVAPEQFGICSNPISLDNLPPIDQRREVKADNIHLQFDSILVLNHGANDSILDLPAVEVDSDFVTGLEFALWLLWGWHARNLP
jgi:hypothetical protein